MERPPLRDSVSSFESGIGAGRSFGMPARLNEIAHFRALGATLPYYPVEWLFERGLEELKRTIAG